MPKCIVSDNCKKRYIHREKLIELISRVECMTDEELVDSNFPELCNELISWFYRLQRKVKNI